jgi:hypothetical protein
VIPPAGGRVKAPCRDKTKMENLALLRPAAQAVRPGSGSKAMSALTKAFLFPGEVVSDLLGAAESDDRMMVRTLVNMLVWNLVVVLIVVMVY